MSWYVMIAGLLRSPWMITLTDPYIVSTSSSCIQQQSLCAQSTYHISWTLSRNTHMHAHIYRHSLKLHQFNLICTVQHTHTPTY